MRPAEQAETVGEGHLTGAVAMRLRRRERSDKERRHSMMIGWWEEPLDIACGAENQLERGRSRRGSLAGEQFRGRGKEASFRDSPGFWNPS